MSLSIDSEWEDFLCGSLDNCSSLLEETEPVNDVLNEYERGYNSDNSKKQNKKSAIC